MVQNSLDKADQRDTKTSLKVYPNRSARISFSRPIHELQRAGDKAQLHYRQALKLDPHSPARQIIWHGCSRVGWNLDEALTFAQDCHGEVTEVSERSGYHCLDLV